MHGFSLNKVMEFKVVDVPNIVQKEMTRMVVGFFRERECGT